MRPRKSRASRTRQELLVCRCPREWAADALWTGCKVCFEAGRSALLAAQDQEVPQESQPHRVSDRGSRARTHSRQQTHSTLPSSRSTRDMVASRPPRLACKMALHGWAGAWDHLHSTGAVQLRGLQLRMRSWVPGVLPPLIQLLGLLRLPPSVNSRWRCQWQVCPEVGAAAGRRIGAHVLRHMQTLRDGDAQQHRVLRHA